MDVQSYLNRTKKTKADLLRDLGKSPKSSLIAAYEKGRSDPSFEMVNKLLKLGMSPLEIFGKEIDDLIRRYYIESIGGLLTAPETSSADKEFDERVRRAVIKFLTNLGRNVSNV